MMPLQWPKRISSFWATEGCTAWDKFEDDESVILAVGTWLREQETSSYREGMHALVSRWPQT